MSLAPERVKQAGEKRPLSFDFTDKLPAGDTIATVTAVTGSPSGLTISASSLLGNVVTVQISSGVNGTRYNVDCEVATTMLNALKLDCTVRISDTDN